MNRVHTYRNVIDHLGEAQINKHKNGMAVLYVSGFLYGTACFLDTLLVYLEGL